jgi:hypothetical protein
MKLFDFFKGVDKRFEEEKNKAIAELTYFLVRRFNFNLDEAFKASKDFWRKYEYKLKEIFG